MESAAGSGSRGQLAPIKKVFCMSRYSYSRKVVRSLASGDELSIPVYTFKGTREGAPSAYLQAAVHGSEVQGSLVIAQLIEFLVAHPPLGDIRLVPNANPVGLNEKRGEYTDGRCDPSTGDNWNRMYFLPTKELDWDKFLRKGEKNAETWARFRQELKKNINARAVKPLPYSEKLCLTLQQLSVDFDHCLDLHCANRSVRHVYVPSYAAKDAAFLGIPLHLLMDNKFSGAMDEVFFHPWWSLQEKIGGPVPVQSFTLELGSHEEISAKGAKQDLAGIVNYLRHRGVLKGASKPARAYRCNLKDYKLIFAPVGGLADFVALPGKRVKRGDVLARIHQFGPKPRAVEVRSPVNGIVSLNHSSSIVHEGAELIKILGKVF
jgi:predicted deacylase